MANLLHHTSLPTHPVVVGHRGSGRSFRPHGPRDSNHPENTRASFLAAHEAGAAWVELDVVASREGCLFLWHDHFVDGVPTHEVPSKVLDDMGIERFENLDAVLPRSLGLDVELKPLPFTSGVGRHGEARIKAEVLEMARHRPVLWTSFDPGVAQAGADAGLAAGWLTRENYPLHEAVMGAASLGVSAAVVHGYTTLEADKQEVINLGFRVARDAGIQIWCWDVTPDRVVELAEAGVTGFCTDHVAEVAAVLKGAGLSD